MTTYFRDRLIFGGVLLVLPFLFWPGLVDELRPTKLVAVALIGGTVIAWNISYFLRPSIAIAFFYILVSGAMIRFGYSTGLKSTIIKHPGGFIQIYPDPHNAVMSIFFVGMAIATCFLVRNLSEKRIGLVMDFVCISGLLQAAWSYLQIFDIDPLFHYAANFNRTNPTGFLGQQTLFGPFVGAAFVACLFRRHWIIALFLVVPIIASKSSFTWIATGTGIGIWLLFVFGAKKVFILSACIVIAILSAFHLKPAWKADVLNDQGRYIVWSNTFNMAKKRPLMGRGIGSFKPTYFLTQSKDSIRQNGKFLNAHNDYLQLFYECGLFGILLVLWMLWDFGKVLWRNRMSPPIVCAGSVLIVYMVNAIGSFPFRLAPQGLIAVWCWTMVATYKHKVLMGGFDGRRQVIPFRGC